jgi:hypothetical protein
MEKPAPIRVELRPSRGFAGLLAAAHGAVLALLLLMPMPAALGITGALAILASAYRSISRQALRRGSQAVNALEFSDREAMRIRTGDGVWHSGRVLGSSTVGTGLTVLNLRVDGGTTRHVVITADGIDRDDFRRLRVWLRWGPGPAGEADHSA